LIAEIAPVVVIPEKFLHLYDDAALRETAEGIAARTQEQEENPVLFEDYCRTILTLYQREELRNGHGNTVSSALAA
jgi:hypothetical protein